MALVEIMVKEIEGAAKKFKDIVKTLIHEAKEKTGITCPLRIFRLQKKAVMMTASVPSAAVYLTYLRMLPEAAEAACASSKHHE